MKKKILSIATALLIIMGVTSSALAAGSCLDVRDYGYHRYAASHATYLKSSTIMGPDEYGNLVVYDEYYDVDTCVCGESKITYYTHVRRVPMGL